MLYAVLCYHSEAVVTSWSKEEDEAVMTRIQGVKAKLAKTFQPEECIGNGKSLGLIEVDLGSVRWVNVRKLSVESADVYRADLGVPDMRLRKFPEVERIEIVGDLAHILDVPAVGLEALDRIVGQGQIGRSVDRDLVVVVDTDQAAQA